MKDDIISLDSLPNALVKRPYETIRLWAEDRFKLIGDQVFSFLALVPHSIFLPKIPFIDREIISSINFMLISPPGSAKSVLIDSLVKFCYEPHNISKMSAPELATSLKGENYVSLYAGDASRIFRDFELSKLMEEIIYDSKVVKNNKRERLNYSINANAILGVTTRALGVTMTDGLFSRLTPMLLILSVEKQNEIAGLILQSIGKRENSKITTGHITDYYKELFKIQLGESEEIKPIQECHFDEFSKERIGELWNKIREVKNVESHEIHNRELESGFKYLQSSAFLNIFNRKVEDGILYPNRDDLRVSLTLLKEELFTKIDLMRLEKFSYYVRDIKQLEEKVLRKEIKLETAQKVKVFLKK